MKPHEYVILEVARERERQFTEEGWTPDHDDVHHNDWSLSLAAACYAAPTVLYNAGYTPFGRDSEDSIEKHPTRRRLVIAAALLVAEIERMDRMTERAGV